MKKLLILTLAFLIGANCTRNNVSQTNKDQSARRLPTTKAPSTPLNRGATVSKEPEKNVPIEFKKIDFENFSYPVSSWGRTVQLQQGKYELANKIAGGRLLSFQDVNYSDLTGDGNKEAIVELDSVLCGGSCDGGSALFYFYSLQRGKPALLSRLETGSVGYDCGLKSFIIKKRMLTLETFRSCGFNGRAFVPSNNDPEERGGKFFTNRFTRFVLEFTGRNFVLRNREIFSYPEDDFRGYEPKIEISDD
jgi:hypothetical protein